MIGNFFEWLEKTINFLWPFQIVDEWELANYYIVGCYWKTMGRGLKFVPPWFCRVITVPKVPARISTNRIELTIEGGSTVSFVASAFARVVDPALAMNAIDDYRETTVEILAATLAEKIGEVDVERLAPEKRKRLLSDMTRWANAEAIQYGVEITQVVFTSFVTNIRLYRLMQDGNVKTGTESW